MSVAPNNGGTRVIAEGNIFALRNLPASVDNQFQEGDIAQFQIRFRAHIPLLADNVRALMQAALGDDLIAVRYPGTIMRIVWRVNLGPLAIAAILLSVAIIVAFMTIFVIFLISPEVAQMIIEGVGGALADIFSTPLTIVGLGLVLLLFLQGFGRRNR